MRREPIARPQRVASILPLQFLAEENAESLNLTGEEIFEIVGIRGAIANFAAARRVNVHATLKGIKKEFKAIVRIDTPQEAQYYANGGILQFVLRQLLAGKPSAEEVHA